jgi:hypothetical protein
LLDTEPGRLYVGAVDMLFVLEVNAEQFLPRGMYRGVGPIGAVATDGRYAYALVCASVNASGYAGTGLAVFDMVDPPHPRLVAALESNGSASCGSSSGTHSSIVVSGTIAYLAGRDQQVNAVSIADPFAPQWLGQLNALSWSLAVTGTNVVFVSGGSLVVADFSNPAAPRVIGSLSQAGLQVVVVGRYAYLTHTWGDAVNVVDLQDPAAAGQLV